jgi:hypothetical protein
MEPVPLSVGVPLKVKEPVARVWVSTLRVPPLMVTVAALLSSVSRSTPFFKASVSEIVTFIWKLTAESSTVRETTEREAGIFVVGDEGLPPT